MGEEGERSMATALHMQGAARGSRRSACPRVKSKGRGLCFRVEAPRLYQHQHQHPSTSSSSSRARTRLQEWRLRSTQEDKGGPESSNSGDDTFADQLWSAARQGVKDMETSELLAVSASSFINPFDNTFDINGFFSSAKTLYLKEEFGQALEMYEEVLKEPGKFSLNGFTIDQVSPLSEAEPDVMKKDYVTARAVCLFNVGCVYTTFGELETAQQFLRDAQQLGLNVNYFLSRGKDPTLRSLDNPYLPVVGAVQVVSNLKRFIDKVKNTKYEAPTRDYENPEQYYLKDLEVKEEMDASVGAIVKRVLKLVAVLTVAGTIGIIAGRIAWYS